MKITKITHGLTIKFNPRPYETTEISISMEAALEEGESEIEANSLLVANVESAFLARAMPLLIAMPAERRAEFLRAHGFEEDWKIIEGYMAERSEETQRFLGFVESVNGSDD